MNLLCFDPGTTTGVAILQEGEWTVCMTVREGELTEALFRSLIRLGSPHTVVIEGLPTYMAHQPSLDAAIKIRKWFEIAGYKVEEVNPGQWKGMTKRPSISGQHQADAAAMGTWYHRSRLVNIFKGE